MKHLLQSFYLLLFLCLLGIFIPSTAARTQDSITNVQRQTSHQLKVQGRIGEDVSQTENSKEPTKPDNGRVTIVADTSNLDKLPKTGSTGAPLIYLGMALLIGWAILVKRVVNQRQTP